MKYLIFIIITFLPSTFAFGESFFCTDEIRTGIFKDKEKWTTKEIKELNFTVKVEGIKIDFKIHGENSFSGCQDFKYDKITDIYQCSNFANLSSLVKEVFLRTIFYLDVVHFFSGHIFFMPHH